MNRNRVLFLMVILLLPIGGLIARLAHLQILSGRRYMAELTARRRSLEIVAPARGRLLDRNGKVLAEDRRAFDLYLVLEDFEKSPEVLPRLALLLGVTPRDLERRIDGIYGRIERQMKPRPKKEHRLILRRERRSPYLLARDIGFDAAFLLETNDDGFPGTVVREGLKRVYPHGPVGSHILGFVGKVSANQDQYERLVRGGYFTEGFQERIGEGDLERLLRRGVFLDEIIGRAGAERTCNDELRGRFGLIVFERQRGRAREETELVPARKGRDEELTIDVELQGFVEGLLAPLTTDAAAVVMDPRNGELLAMASNRGFNPNHFVPPAKPEDVEPYLEPGVPRSRRKNPLVSRVFQEQFQLGSVFKIVTAAAALENRLVRPETEIVCEGKFRPDWKHFNCHVWNQHRGVHGPLALRAAMERSCNIYFYTIGDQMGVQGLNYWALQFGLGKKTGLDLDHEAEGALPSPTGRRGDAYNLAIGQGNLMVTPLQVAELLAMVANDGWRVVPHVRRSRGPRRERSLFTGATLEEIRRSLYEVVHGAHGTARRTALIHHDVAGKTSSAQNRPGEKAHAWFAGFAPYNQPLYVIVVFVKNGGSGGEVAAPIAAKIVRRLLGGGKEPEGGKKS